MFYRSIIQMDYYQIADFFFSPFENPNVEFICRQLNEVVHTLENLVPKLTFVILES